MIANEETHEKADEVFWFVFKGGGYDEVLYS